MFSSEIFADFILTKKKNDDDEHFRAAARGRPAGRLGASPPNPTREKEARGNTAEKGGAMPPQPPGARLRLARGLCPQIPDFFLPPSLGGN